MKRINEEALRQAVLDGYSELPDTTPVRAATKRNAALGAEISVATAREIELAAEGDAGITAFLLSLAGMVAMALYNIKTVTAANPELVEEQFIDRLRYDLANPGTAVRKELTIERKEVPN